MIRIFLDRARYFVYLNNLYISNESYVNDTLLEVITPNQEFC